MILSGKEIQRQMNNHNIKIIPFDEKRINPNSYNLSLHNELLVYNTYLIDMKKDNKIRAMIIPEEGFILRPGTLYLARTAEFTETKDLVPMLEGRSSVGRLGVSIHVTAGFGDVGFKGYWTLEMHCIEPVRIYAGVEICQIFYHTIKGDYDNYDGGKYQKNKGIQASKLFMDFDEEQLCKKDEIKFHCSMCPSTKIVELKEGYDNSLPIVCKCGCIMHLSEVVSYE